jgi:hypothetical protein
MKIQEIQEMFSEMGLGSSEQREKIVRELSINMVDGSYNENKNIKICNNTLNP